MHGAFVSLIVDTIKREVRCGEASAGLADSSLLLGLLVALARARAPVPTEELFAQVWGRAMRKPWDQGSLYVLVSRLRALLVPLAGRADLVVTSDQGYALHVDVTPCVVAADAPAEGSLDHPLSVLAHLAHHATVDNRSYRFLRGVSRSTAWRELDTLARAGLLVRKSGGRGARYQLTSVVPRAPRARSAEAVCATSVDQRIAAEQDPHRRARLVRDLARAGQSGLSPAERLLDDPDERVRANALEVLTDLGHLPGLARLEALAVGAGLRMRAAALVALARLARIDVRDAVWKLVASDAVTPRDAGCYVARALHAEPSAA